MPEETLQVELQLSKDTRQYVVSGSRDKTVKLFEALQGICLMTFRGHDNWVTDLVFHPNNKYLLSVSDDKSIRIWDLQ